MMSDGQPNGVAVSDARTSAVWTSAVRRPTADLLAIIASVILLGALVGGIWTAVTPAMTGRVVGPDSALIPAEQFPEEFAGVGTFALLMFGYGVLATLVVWFCARTWRGPGGFAILLAASLLGGALAAWVGTGLADWRFDGPRDVSVGSTFRVVPQLWLDSATPDFSEPWILLICAPLAVAFAYLVCALLAKSADLGVGDLGVGDLGGGEYDEVTSVDEASQTHQ